MDINDLLNLPFEPFVIDHGLDSRKHFDYRLDPAFPLSVRLMTFASAPPPYPLNWHERLEIFVPLIGQGVFAMGSDLIPFEPGDVLVVDSLSLHGITEFHGPRRAGMTIYFMPQLICGLGSMPCDSVLLGPFLRPPGSGLPIIKSQDDGCAVLQHGLFRLANCLMEPNSDALVRAKCKIYLLEVLHLLASHFNWAHRGIVYKGASETQNIRLLHEYMLAHFSGSISVSTAASMISMSKTSFTRYFKRVTGQTFIQYLNRLRLERALELLKETELTIAEIAASTGFSDQSYFSRTFRRYFHQSPNEARRALAPIAAGLP